MQYLDATEVHPSDLPSAVVLVLPSPPVQAPPKKGEEKLHVEGRSVVEEQSIRDVVGERLTLVTPSSLQHRTLVPVGTEQGDGSHRFCARAQGTLGEADRIPHQSCWEEKGSCRAHPQVFRAELGLPSSVLQLGTRWNSLSPPPWEPHPQN